MSTPSLNQEIELLETRLTEVANLCVSLRQENKALRAQQHELVEERAKLIEKNEMARSRVEQMITRLKSMEAG